MSFTKRYPTYALKLVIIRIYARDSIENNTNSINCFGIRSYKLYVHHLLHARELMRIENLNLHVKYKFLCCIYILFTIDSIVVLE